MHTCANFEVVLQIRHDIIIHFVEETKSQALSWLHRPHSGFLQDGPSVMEDDEFLTCQVKTVDMLGVSKTLKSSGWTSAVVLTLVCSWVFSCRRRDSWMSGRILRSHAFSTRFRWASPVVVHGFPRLSLARIQRDMFNLFITSTNSPISKNIDVYTYLSINFRSPMNVDRRHVFCIQELYQYTLFHRTDILALHSAMFTSTNHGPPKTDV